MSLAVRGALHLLNYDFVVDGTDFDHQLSLPNAGRTMVRWVTGGSFLASHDKRIAIGLGRRLAPESLSVDIRWPNGQVQRVSGLTPNRYHRITETQ